MVNIEGIQVDTATDINSLSNEWAVFTVEFEFDSRLIVCHVFNQTVYKGIKSLIQQILSVKAKSIELRQALLNSRYITVNIEKYGLEDKFKVLAYKYELIKANKTYFPYGYNTFVKVGTTLEQNYADILLRELMDDIDRNAAYPQNSLYSLGKKGRTPKPVYSYDKNTGFPVGKYASVKDAAEDTGICASNISMCCSGHIRTAGQYIWSYISQPIIDVHSLRDNRFKDTQIPSETDIAAKQQKFIAKNQK